MTGHHYKHIGAATVPIRLITPRNVFDGSWTDRLSHQGHTITPTHRNHNPINPLAAAFPG